MPFRIILLALALLLSGCRPSGPATAHTKSSTISTLAQRAAFLHTYVSFRRTYETLDFDIDFHNNGGGLVPGPSDWDIRIITTVPEVEIPQWIPAGVSASAAPSDITWLQAVPTSLDLTGVTEWYIDGQRTIGIDRTKRIVVYRLSTS